MKSSRFSSVRSHLPARTVRSRLTLVYGGLFLVSGAALLVITAVLWGRATNGKPIVAYSKFSGRILSIVASQQHVPVGPPFFVPSGAVKAPPQARLTGQAVGKLTAQLHSVAAAQQAADLHQLLLYSGIALAIMAGLALGLGWLTAGRMLRPLRTISSTAQQISVSNLHERLDLAGPDDELKKLGDTIDQLLGRLERSFDAQRLFVANASHELRTPLATMRASIDVALAKPAPIPEETKRLAGGLRQELDQVDRLLESFLSLARAERGPTEEEVVLPLDELVASALDERAGVIAASQFQMTVEQCPQAAVSGDETLLARMTENLLDNAVQHNLPGGFLRVRTAVEDQTAMLVVENSAPVVEDEALQEMVQPFRRLGVARTGGAGGFGLGLSIVAAVAESHGGHLSLHGLEGGGFQAVVELPLAVRVPVGASG